MRDLSKDLQEKIKSSVFSTVETVNKNLVSHFIVDDVYVSDSTLFIRLGNTGTGFVSSVEINSFCRLINESLYKLYIVPVSSCRFIGIDFTESLISFIVVL